MPLRGTVATYPRAGVVALDVYARVGRICGGVFVHYCLTCQPLAQCVPAHQQVACPPNSKRRRGPYSSGNDACVCVVPESSDACTLWRFELVQHTSHAPVLMMVVFCCSLLLN